MEAPSPTNEMETPLTSPRNEMEALSPTNELMKRNLRKHFPYIIIKKNKDVTQRTKHSNSSHELLPLKPNYNV